MNDHHDDTAVRLLVETAVRHAPPAPSFDRITATNTAGESPTPHEERSSMRRFVGVVAAAAVLIAALVAIQATRDDDERDVPADAPSQQVRLPVHVLPTGLPEGWRLVDLVEAGGSDISVAFDAVQLFRRTGDNAVIRIQIHPSIDPSQSQDTAASLTTAGPPRTAPERTDTVFEPNTVTTWSEAGAGVALFRVGVSEADASAFARQLEPSGQGAELRYLSTDPAWQLEASDPYVPPHPDTGPAGQLTFTDGNGNWLTTYLTSTAPVPYVEFGIPELHAGITLYTSPTGVTRSIGSLGMYTSFDDPTLRDFAVAMMSSLAPVDTAEWDQAANDLAVAVMTDRPEVTFDTGRVVITEYEADQSTYVCARSDAGDGRCHEIPQQRNAPGFNVVPFSTTLNLGDRWVHVSVNPVISPADLPEVKGVPGAGDAVTAIGNVTPTSVIIFTELSADAPDLTLTYILQGEPTTEKVRRPAT